MERSSTSEPERDLFDPGSGLPRSSNIRPKQNAKLSPVAESAVTPPAQRRQMWTTVDMRGSSPLALKAETLGSKSSPPSAGNNDLGLFSGLPSLGSLRLGSGWEAADGEEVEMANAWIRERGRNGVDDLL
jgi:hypothetical protein